MSSAYLMIWLISLIYYFLNLNYDTLGFSLYYFLFSLWAWLFSKITPPSLLNVPNCCLQSAYDLYLVIFSKQLLIFVKLILILLFCCRMYICSLARSSSTSIFMYCSFSFRKYCSFCSAKAVTVNVGSLIKYRHWWFRCYVILTSD